MEALLIINPVSGDTEPNTEKVAAIEQWLAPSGLNLRVVFTGPDQSAGAITRTAVQAGVQVILVGGGDGTVSEVARELVCRPVTLGILPVGTFNNIARSLHLLGDLEHACAIINAGHVREVDVGLANGTRYFFEAAGAGLDALLFPIGEEIKGGRWSRIWEAARLAWRYEPQHVRITFNQPVMEVLSPEQRLRLRGRALARARDRCTIRRRALLVIAANGPYYGGGLTVAPGARMSDGRLTLSVYRNFSKWELMRHFRSIGAGRYRYSPKIESFSASEITLSSPEVIPVHVDGEPFGFTPLTLRAVPRGLRVFAPPLPGENTPAQPSGALSSAQS